jgi:hypothetical protein
MLRLASLPNVVRHHLPPLPYVACPVSLLFVCRTPLSPSSLPPRMPPSPPLSSSTPPPPATYLLSSDPLTAFLLPPSLLRSSCQHPSRRALGEHDFEADFREFVQGSRSAPQVSSSGVGAARRRQRPGVVAVAVIVPLPVPLVLELRPRAAARGCGSQELRPGAAPSLASASPPSHGARWGFLLPRRCTAGLPPLHGGTDIVAKVKEDGAGWSPPSSLLCPVSVAAT